MPLFHWRRGGLIRGRLVYTVKPVYKDHSTVKPVYKGHSTVKPVYKDHSRKPENVTFMSSCPLYTD